MRVIDESVNDMSKNEQREKIRLLRHLDTFSLGAMVKREINIRSFGQPRNGAVLSIFNDGWLLNFEQKSFESAILTYIKERPELQDRVKEMKTICQQN